jgi:N-acetyl sugar amidotransferase
MDDTDPDISFDTNGFCNHCTDAFFRLKQYPFNLSKKEKENKLLKKIKDIKNKKKGDYDCIIGVSGGLDSTYIAFKVKEFGLNPLAVHVDNGWNTELSVKNIEKTLKKLDIDLFTKVLDWEGFKDLQLSFLKSSTPDLEIPTDHSIISTLFETANRYKVNTIIAGWNTSTELIMPRKWSNGHWDWYYISNIQKRFGTRQLINYPHLNIVNFFINKIKRVENFYLLDYLDYNREEAMKTLKSEINWREYSRKHGESIYTKFVQEYILPKKFCFDKRRAHLSTLICSGQLTREEAIEKMNEPLYSKTDLEEDIEYVTDKLCISKDDFFSYMNLPNKTYFDYPSYETNPFLKKLKFIYNKIITID